MKLLSIVLLPSVSAFIIQHSGFIGSSCIVKPSTISLSASLETVLENEEILSPSITVARPEIHWTVPGFKIGWQDENGNWFDEDGPRNGPPQNYWRQSVDQGDYNRDMEAVTAVLSPDCDVEIVVSNLIKSRSTSRPSLNRKVLGSWAPILLNGKCVASISKSSNGVTKNPMFVIDEHDPIEIPFKINISRKNGRRFAPKNHYGTFDKRLDAGEDLFITTSTAIKSEFMVTVFADEDNSSRIIGMIGTNKREPLHFGGIMYISDYVMIQRDTDGAYDFWLRADKSHLGATPRELQEYEEKIRLK